MTYTKLFDPDHPPAQPYDPSRAYRLGDQPASAAYVFDDDIVLAVNVAMAAGRPLLVRGRPGTGKSSLAPTVADQLGWRFYSVTVSSRTAARDLLWTFDTVARLADAQARKLGPWRKYVRPGVLWWAFNREGALGYGTDPCRTGNPNRAVVLIDEIDKADPDVPNDLLVPLGSFRFPVDDLPVIEAEHPPLVIVTTNEERDLPRAFLRRCVVLKLEEPKPPRLRDIIRSHFPTTTEDFLDDLLAEYERISTERLARREPPPSVAELIDAVAACRNLDQAQPGVDTDWPGFARLLLDKVTTMPEGV